jgi:hypothetical protein
MKCRNVFICLGVALCGLFATQNSIFAQGTAFTYQGQLLLNSTVVNGQFDLQFKLRPATNGVGQIGPTLTNAPTGVTNGLFTVALDFGDVFNVSPLFLEVGVRTNGSTAAYVILSPLQPITSAPYAVQALQAATFLGGVSDAQLSANVPRLNASNNFTGNVTFSNAAGNFNGNFTGNFSGNSTGTFNGTGTGTFNGIFNGNGGNVTNLNITNLVGVVQSNPNWQLIQATTQQAVAANNYLTTNAGQTTLILPPNSAVSAGSTLQISGSGIGGWVLPQNAGQSIITSTLNLPAGQNWSPAGTTTTWRCLTSSADGMRMAAGVGFGTGSIFYSTNGGQTWVKSSSPSTLNWTAIACSADGMHMIAAPNNNTVYTSTDGGVTWTQQTAGLDTGENYVCAASSADGINLTIAGGNTSGNIFTSTNSGTNWVKHSPSLPENWTSVASSADGTRLAAVAHGSLQIFVSKDSGNTWASNGLLASWSSIASSADGSRLIAADNNSTGNLYISGDGGTSWTPRGPAETWTAVCSSSNGMNLAAAYGGGLGFVYTSSDGGQTWLQRTNGIAASGQNFSAIASSGTGSRLVTAVNNGQIFNSIASTTIGTGGTLIGSQYAVLGLQYVGNGQWIPLTSIGSFTGN